MERKEELKRPDMDGKTCKCAEVKWECWVKEYDSDNPGFVPGLWFSTECVSCGRTDFIPHAELDESAIPKEVLERGLKWLKKQDGGEMK